MQHEILFSEKGLINLIRKLRRKVRKTAFFMKIDPAPFSDFGAAEGGTVMPKKIWRRRRRQNH